MTHQQFLDMLLTAMMQARMAVALYDGREALHTLAGAVGARFRYIEIAYLRVGMLIFDDHVHVSVCGSNDLHDWAQNLTAKLAKFAGFDAHSGFVDSARLVQTAMKQSGMTELIKAREIVLGGHSAGGAIAQALSLMQWLNPREVITFGCPRVFSSQSAAYYASLPWDVRRFVMQGDPVPRFPLRKFRALFGGATYAHTSAPITIGTDGKLALEQEPSVLHSLLQWIIGSWTCGITTVSILVGRLPKLLANHSMDRYHDAIDTAIKELRK